LQFSKLDDQDIYAAVKVWENHSDVILARLCKMLNARKLYKVEITNDAPTAERIAVLSENTATALGLAEDDISYFVFTDTIRNRAYNAGNSNINILMKNGALIDITKASDLSNLESLDRTVRKHILCYTRLEQKA
jgi:hypothetical protein